MTGNNKDAYFNTFMLFTKISDSVIKHIDEKIYDDFQSSFIRYSVLGALVKSKGILKHSDLAAWTNTKKHNITALIERMKEDELVTTKWSQTDRRIHNVLITDKGRNLYKQIDPQVRKMIERLTEGMKEADVRESDRLLNIVKENLKTGYKELKVDPTKRENL